MDTYTLVEIASWASPGNKDVAIPALQRGLVWKPHQVELLWDSIFRGFPIGSFLLSSVSVPGDNQADYYLMDGQQRFNAISIGFHTVENPRAVLWLDINPPKTTSTRRFWIKACTSAHPWGYMNNDECKALTAAEKRKALDQFGLSESICKQEPDLKLVWPVQANRPIPLHYFLKAYKDPQKVFDLCEKNPDGFAYLKKAPLTNEDLAYMQKICTELSALCDLDEYTVSCNYIDKKTIETETEEASEGGSTSLEILFTRLNTAGTRISPEDLYYSAIKAYWPSIRDLNDSIARGYMSPSKLVMLAFRYALREKEKFPTPLSIKRIRSIARQEKDNAQKILDLYGDDCSSPLKSLLDKADKTLRGDGLDRIPAYIRNSLCYQSPDAFLLLMLLVEESTLPDAFIRGLIIYLHWFCNDGCQLLIVNEILKCSIVGFSADSVRQALTSAVANEWIIPLASPDSFSKLFEIGGHPGWKPSSVGGNSPWIDLYNRVRPWDKSVPREMLLYCQRRYINVKFTAYDPARQDLWEDINRPWDYDHIIPQNWVIGSYKSDYRWYCKEWLNCIGNIGAIPYEINRSIGDTDNFDEYKKNQDLLLFDTRFEELDRVRLTQDEAHARPFAEVTWDRLCLIYKTVYDLIEPVISDVVLSYSLSKRKTIFECVQERLPGSVIGFVAKDDEFSGLSPLDWARPWISVGVEKNGYFVCATWGEGKPIEFGVRKPLYGKRLPEGREGLPDKIDGYVPLYDNAWWYFWRKEEITESLTPEHIVDTILSIVNNPNWPPVVDQHNL